MPEPTPVRVPEPEPAPAAAAPVRVVAGHYGSGKTEFSVSLALAWAQAGRRVALADLDIVNPYFRSRERADLLEASGVWVISSMLGHTTTIEIPAISPEVRAPLTDPTWELIIDLGGDDVGAKVAAQYRADLVQRGYELLFVVNAYRPETATADAVVRYLRRIEDASGLRATALVSNTHLLRETTTGDVVAGLELCAEVSAATGLPVAYVVAIASALAGLPPDAPGVRLPVGPTVRDEWM